MRKVRRGLRWGRWAFLVVLMVFPALTSSGQIKAATTPTSGMICTVNNSTAITLTAQAGYMGLPDGNTIYMWSYSAGGNPFQLPGPTLCVTEGQTISIVLHNTLPEAVSLIFPGQDGVLADGAPAQPQFDQSGTLLSLTNAAGPGGSVTYSFTAGAPGTYLYESGTNPEKQIQMGLYGALIVRPAMGANFAYNRADSEFNPATEYLMLLSEVDPELHQAVERGTAYNPTTYRPRYWLINGRSFPDTIQDNNSPLLPAQPYGALVHIKADTPAAPGKPALVRYINVGQLAHPFHPHGNHGRVIARDGQPLATPEGEDLSYEKFLVLVGQGQTWDVTYRWTDVEGWDPSTNPIPVQLPQQQNTFFKDSATWYSGSPYLGVKGDLPNGVTSFNQCGEYYQVWHSHALNEATNFDVGFGGMFTLERIDPLVGCP